MPLVKIARQKSGAVHFAKRVAANGFVAEWVDSEEKCVPVAEEVADLVAKFYDGRVNGGVIIFEGVGGKQYRAPVRGKEDPESAGVSPKPVGVASEGEFQKQARVLGEENEELRFEIDKLRVELKARAEKIVELEAIIASAK